MLRAAAWFSRLAGLVPIGLLTFLVKKPTEPGGAGTQAVVYVVACLGLLALLVVDVWPGGLPDRAARVLLPGCHGVVIVAGCIGASAGGTGDVLISFSVGSLMAAGSELGLIVVLWLAALGLLAVEGGAVVFGQGVGTLVGFPLLLVVGTLVGRNRAAYRIQAEQAAALLARHEQLRAEERWADILGERARIAREIHDVLAHSLGALSIQIQTARALFTELDEPERALDVLATAQRMVSDGLTETRRAVLALRTDSLPLHEELARVAAEHGDVYSVSVRCVIEGTPHPVPADATIALLRTASECLMNAAKHASGRAVDITLAYVPDAVRLSVITELADGSRAAADEPAGSGTGVPQTINGGYGLTGIQERLRLLRGTLDAGVRGREWVVAAELPLVPCPTPERADR